ncbi:MAG: hypothetical protein EG822_07110 [Deltaproteobacteria bacterium]|nr:hypothetical protein [Deltaproteobacteria bacterium]TLN01979.1 MAG: hypothetical protein FDZ73_13735 [bacterium]
MLIRRKELLNTEVIQQIVCDRCGRTASPKDAEYEEFIQIRHRGGYASVIGDGTNWSLDVCQHCFVKVFEKYILRYDEE